MDAGAADAGLVDGGLILGGVRGLGKVQCGAVTVPTANFIVAVVAQEGFAAAHGAFPGEQAQLRQYRLLQEAVPVDSAQRGGSAVHAGLMTQGGAQPPSPGALDRIQQAVQALMLPENGSTGLFSSLRGESVAPVCFTPAKAVYMLFP